MQLEEISLAHRSCEAMKSVLLISSMPLDLHELANHYKHCGSVNLQSDKRLVVEGVWGWFALNVEPDAEDEMSASEIDRIRQSILVPSYCQLEFGSANAAELAVSNFIPRFRVLIDNDFGVLWSLEEVQRRIKAHEDWLSAREDTPAP